MKRSPMAAMSAKRRAALAATGVAFPSSTLLSRKPAAKAPRDTGPKRTVRDLVRARSGGVCEHTGCGHAATQQHHRRPRRMGGTQDPAVNLASNLLDFCDWHHRQTEYHRTASIAKGLLLHAGEDPARVPVWTRHHEGPVWLLPDGTWVRYEEEVA